MLTMLLASLHAFAIAFADLQDPSLLGEKIQIRGYLQQTVTGDYYLTEVPDVRSCCLGKSSKRFSQVQLEKSFSPDSSQIINQLITVEGLLSKDKKKEAEPLILMAATPLLPKPTWPWKTMTLLAICLSLAWLYRSYASRSIPLRKM
jgi:hypothetical protein